MTARDRGSASVWLLAVGLVLLAAGLAGATVGGAHVAAHQARTAADLGALAGAARALQGEPAACARAAELVAANHARLTSCALDGLDLTVTVAVTPPAALGISRPATATARAGPVRAGVVMPARPAVIPAGPAVILAQSHVPASRQDRALARGTRHNGGMRWAVVPAPIGPVAVGLDDYGVRAVRFRPDGVRPEPRGDGGLLDSAVSQLAAYFAGERTGFDLPLSVPEDQGSGFERAVWARLAYIPYGEMRTYGELAAALGEPDAARAVGAALNRNPVPILLPCHRVVGAGGKLVGFGGGLPRKRWLLEHEARIAMQRAWG